MGFWLTLQPQQWWGLSSCLLSFPLSLDKYSLNLYHEPDIILHTKDMKQNWPRNCSQRDYNLVGNVTKISMNDWRWQTILLGKESVKASKEVTLFVFISLLTLVFLTLAATR